MMAPWRCVGPLLLLVAAVGQERLEGRLILFLHNMLRKLDSMMLINYLLHTHLTNEDELFRTQHTGTFCHRKLRVHVTFLERCIPGDIKCRVWMKRTLRCSHSDEEPVLHSETRGSCCHSTGYAVKVLVMLPALE